MSVLNLSPADKENLMRLRLPLALLAASLLTGFGLYYGTGKLKEKAEAELKAAQHKLVAARTARQQAQTDRQTVGQYLPRYRQLLADGLVGKTERFALIDTLKQVGARNMLYPVEYQLEEPHPYPLATIPSGGNLRIVAHPLSLRFSLLHEGDLAVLLHGLREGLKGMVTVTRCELARRDSANTALALKENLTAECQFDWLSLEVPAEEEKAR